MREPLLDGTATRAACRDFCARLKGRLLRLCSLTIALAIPPASRFFLPHQSGRSDYRLVHHGQPWAAFASRVGTFPVTLLGTSTSCSDGRRCHSLLDSHGRSTAAGAAENQTGKPKRSASGISQLRSDRGHGENRPRSELHARTSGKDVQRACAICPREAEIRRA